MSQSIANWEKHFKEDLTRDQREELFKALTVVKNDPMFKKEFDWTGLFTLRISVVGCDPELWTRYSEAIWTEK